MKSVGESMAFGRTFQEAFQKALRSLETGLHGFGCASRTAPAPATGAELEALRHALRTPSPERMSAVHRALASGMTEAQARALHPPTAPLPRGASGARSRRAARDFSLTGACASVRR